MNKEQVISRGPSTDIYTKKSQELNQIVLKIENADPKWASIFLQEETSDFKIQHRDFYYPVHRNVIFKNISLHVLDQSCQEGVLTLPNCFNSQMIHGVISCLYSLELKICRSQALEALDIIHCLHIPKLQRILQEDIKNNIEQYQLFRLLEKSLFMGMSQIEEMCLNQLQLDSYEQMCYEKYQLLECNEETFKYVVRHHNERRWEEHTFGQSQKFIKEIIDQYAIHNDYDAKSKQKLIKQFEDHGSNADFHSFNKIKLTPLKITVNELSEENKLYTPRALAKNNKATPKLKSLSPFRDNCCSTKSMIVDLTYMGEKKRKGSRNSEHNNSQSKIASDYVILKDKNRIMTDEFQKLKESIENMTKTIKQKDMESRNNKFKLGQIQVILEQCENQLMEENRSLMLLDVRTDKLTMRSLEPDAEPEYNNSDIVESVRMIRTQGQSPDCQSSEEKPKVPNEKDQTLRVSLIASRWVCC